MSQSSRQKRIFHAVPAMAKKDAQSLCAILQDRLNALKDLALTLEPIQGNGGPQFIGVHTMLDKTAERIATRASVPTGTPGAQVKQRSWDDCLLGRSDALADSGALDLVYEGVIEAQRDAIDASEEPDPVTQDMLIAQSGQLEQFHWLLRAHFAASSGLSTAGARTETQAASRARR